MERKVTVLQKGCVSNRGQIAARWTVIVQIANPEYYRFQATGGKTPDRWGNPLGRNGKTNFSRQLAKAGRQGMLERNHHLVNIAERLGKTKSSPSAERVHYP
ncbi:MAG: hypothetical protein HQM06_12675 [Magnetococcales bacterium]|nr:hypothetical protein [Magnetococcales bacterium]